MSNYNHAQYLPAAVDAILAQSYQPKELIIIDDASTDNSMEVLESYAAKFNIIRLIRNEKNLGAVINMNKLLGYATGDYVCTAGADDKVLPGFFEKTMNLVTRHPQAGLCSGLALRMNMKGENIGLDYLPIVSRQPVYFSSEQCKAMICKYDNWIHSTATIYLRDALLAAGGFIPELHSYCDVFVGFVIALKHGVCYIPEPLSAFRITDSNYRSIFERQPELLFEVKECMNRLISSCHAGLFPDEFIEESERVAIYNYNRILCLSSSDIYDERVKHLNGSRTPPIRFLRGIIQPLLHSENIISKLYCFLHSGRKIYYPFLRKCLKFSHLVVNRKCSQIRI
jgi:glycosyltransferase involved in cell wall biosynthesis